ncbi:MAG TPA: glycosyltransferase family 4 protein [Longimicrobiales bacterium]
MHVTQVIWVLDPLRREPAALLEAWPTLCDVACAAAAPDVSISVVLAAQRPAVIERGGVRIHFVRGGGRAGVVRSILRRVAALRPDLLHVHGLSFPLQTRALARAFPAIPVLVQDHGSRPPVGWRRALHRWGYARIAGAAFTARAQAEAFLAARVLRADLPVFEVLESSSHFTPGDRAAARAATGIDGDPCLLWVGRLDANKDPLTVLEAVSRALPALPGARLWLCYTDAPLLDAVRVRLAAEPELAERVRLLGRLPHGRVQDVLRAADFLVLGSHAEGSGYAVIEALACGTTPLVTDIPSFRRITGGGAFGALSPPGDAEAMARALVDWAARDRVALRRAARAHFERALSFDAVGGELRAAYRAIVAHRHRSHVAGAAT